MFYHAEIEIVGIDRARYVNLTLDDVLARFACPLITGDVSYYDNGLVRLQSFVSLRVFASAQPVTSTWPVVRAEVWPEDKKEGWEGERDWTYSRALGRVMVGVADDVTMDVFRAAVERLSTGGYRSMLTEVATQLRPSSVFFICETDNADVRAGYDAVIKPTLAAHGFAIERADDISHTRTITEVITGAIQRSAFVIADLTGERPNCYYEVGYAHSLGKPVLITAKRGTARHFDIAAYRWNYWETLPELQAIVDHGVTSIKAEISGVREGRAAELGAGITTV